jgi:2-polyprenyl-6-methoxyphenol hydroxylase-like FAD-dependent oxidoreductase
MSVPSTPTDVLIVGMGPVGATLALLLAKRGRAVTLLERQPAPYGLPRAVHIDDGAARVLQAAGVGAVFNGNSQPTREYEWRNAEGITLLRLGNERTSNDGWPSSSMIHQPTIEGALNDEVHKSPSIVVHRGETVAALQQDPVGVTVTSVNGNGDETVRSARFVVGCDGANSIVRSQMNMSTVDLGFFFNWLIVDVMLNTHREFSPENLQVCDPLRPTTAVSGGPGRRRWEFMCLPGEDPSSMNDEATAWRLLRPWDVHPENAKLERHAVYRFQAMWVNEWRKGRVFVAGDAAHLMPPFAGQGLCSGLKDVMNLAWKIDHALGSETMTPEVDRLLDSYQSERTPHVKGAIELSVELGKIICVPDPAEAAARDAAMAPMAAQGASVPAPPPPPITEGFISHQFPLAGRTFPQSAKEGHRSDDLFGRRWKLVTMNTAPSLAALAPSEAFQSIGDTVMLDSFAGEVDNTISDWFTEHDVVAALVRPDSIVFGACADLTQVDVLVSEVTDLVA